MGSFREHLRRAERAARQHAVEWLLRDVHLRNVAFGEHSIHVAVDSGGTTDIIRWTAAQDPLASMDLGMAADGHARVWVGGSAKNCLVEGDIGTLPTETGEYFCQPEGATTGNSTRVANTVFDGASLTLRRPVTASRILFRATGQAGAPTARILIFQTADGGSGVASRVATVTGFAIPASGNYLATFAEGSVTFNEGLIYVLYGRDSAAGSWTCRTFTTQAVDLCTANVNTDTHPTSFTTAIAATTSPATFNPLQTPTGEATGTASDVIPVIRLLA